MKRFLTILVAAVALTALSTSCNKDEYGTYDFFCNTVTDARDQTRANNILNSVFSDSYFTTIHSYTAKYSQAASQAAKEFDEHIDKLDFDYIKSQLQFPETVKISLWSMDPGQCLLTCLITYDNQNGKPIIIKEEN